MTELVSSYSTVKAFNSGYQSLPWVEASIQSLTSTIDLNSIIKHPDYKKRIQALKPLELYRAIKKVGANDCLEVIEAMSAEQMVAVFDYDVWHQNAIVPKIAFGWLKIIGALGTKALYKKYTSLDEEYQIGLLNKYLKVYDADEFEKMSDKEQDQLSQFPDESMYFKVDSDDDEIVDAVNELIKGLMAENMAYAMSLVAHASYMPLNESEHMLTQFRNARIEEDGFCTYEESLAVFERVNLTAKLTKWQQVGSGSPIVQNHSDDSKQNFLQTVLFGPNLTGSERESIQSSLLLLANNLCAASDVETDDISSIEKILMGASGMVSVALETLAGKDTVLAAEILRTEYPKELFRTGLTIVDDLRKEAFEMLALVVDNETVDKLRTQYNRLNNGYLLDWFDRNLLDRLGQKWVELLKGLFNRFPSAPVTSDTGDKILFKPVQSIGMLVELSEQLHGIQFLLKTLSFEPGNLFQSISTKFIQSCVGENQDLDKFENLSSDEITAGVEDFNSFLREKYQNFPGYDCLPRGWNWALAEVEEVVETLKTAHASGNSIKDSYLTQH